MSLHIIDLTIIIGYLVLTIIIGFWISKKAKKNLDSYFLGGKTLPWYMLGLSNASGQFDISGTMMMVAWMFVYGVKSAWIPWLWPVWNQIFLMIFLAVWLRRSNVLTGAEWLKTRFGSGQGATLSHISVVTFAIVAVIGFIAYAFEGIGKFSTTFLPWDLSTNIIGIQISSERMYALLIMGITTIYVIKGGMYSVVVTEVLQFTIMTISCIAIGIIAMNMVSGEQLSAVIPEGWKSLIFSWKLDLDWSNIIPQVNEKIKSDGYGIFGAFMMMAIFRGIFVSIAGPVPGYDMQRVLAARSPKEAALMSGSVSLALYFPRYLMITGLAILGLVYFDAGQLMTSGGIDFEKILPFTLSNYIPAGLLGLVLAGLIAAFMSTFAANVNAGPAYIVNDIYKRFINPNASNKRYVVISYFASFGVVIIGVTVGFFISSINDIFLWITGALFGGYAVSNALKWIWWRFNGYGFFWGMLSGLLAALIIPKAIPDAGFLVSFPIIFGISSLGSILGCLLTKPEDEKVLIEFYKNVRPWGFWKPIHQKINLTDPDFKKNENFGRDMLNSFIGIIWQLSLTLMPIFLVIRENANFIIAFIGFIVTSLILKFNWFDKLEN
ncbi:MAG: sodium:solute symporter family protein [Bacteroidota bacterium]|nr:sodium:solute symporter family protein [Bacteroidota bacterium]